MKNTILKHVGIALALPIILAVSVARADVLTTNTDTELIPSTDPAISVGFNIAQFNPALGTLHSVQLTVSGSAVASLIFTNLDGPNGGVAMQESNTFSIVYNSSDDLVQDSFVWQTPHWGLSGLSGYERPGTSNVYAQTWGPETEGPVTVSFTLAPDLANFTGAGNILVASAFDDIFSGGAIGGNNTIHVTTTGSATAQVIYDFIPVPEPSTCCLLLLGLGGLLAAARHKKP